MDPNNLQQLPSAAYMHKLNQASQPNEPFAAFDTLTPDEPLWIWKMTRRILSYAGMKLHTKSESTPQTVGLSQPQSLFR